MKKMFNVRSIVAMIIMATIATTAFAGCNQSTGGNQESSLAPSLSVSEVRQDESSEAISKSESPVIEKSSVDSVEEKSEVEPPIEPSKVETSKEESSKAEKSEVETSVEPSKVESSAEESSKETSHVESSLEQSKEESSASESSNSVSTKDAIRYGRLIKRSPISDLDDLSSFTKMIHLSPNSLIVILKINDVSAYDNYFAYETYEVLYSGKRYVIAADDVELFTEDYVPDFTDEHWVGLN